MYRRGGKIKKKNNQKIKSKNAFHSYKDENEEEMNEQSIRTITIQNGEIVEDITNKNETESGDELIAKQVLRKLDFDTTKLLINIYRAEDEKYGVKYAD